MNDVYFCNDCDDSPGGMSCYPCKLEMANGSVAPEFCPIEKGEVAHWIQVPNEDAQLPYGTNRC